MTTVKVLVCSPVRNVIVSTFAVKPWPRLVAVTLVWEVASPSTVATSIETSSWGQGVQAHSEGQSAGILVGPGVSYGERQVVVVDHMPRGGQVVLRVLGVLGVLGQSQVEGGVTAPVR